jgi:hypothetical protein
MFNNVVNCVEAVLRRSGVTMTSLARTESPCAKVFGFLLNNDIHIIVVTEQGQEIVVERDGAPSERISVFASDRERELDITLCDAYNFSYPPSALFDAVVQCIQETLGRPFDGRENTHWLIEDEGIPSIGVLANKDGSVDIVWDYLTVAEFTTHIANGDDVRAEVHSVLLPSEILPEPALVAVM